MGEREERAITVAIQWQFVEILFLAIHPSGTSVSCLFPTGKDGKDLYYFYLIYLRQTSSSTVDSPGVYQLAQFTCLVSCFCHCLVVSALYYLVRQCEKNILILLR